MINKKASSSIMRFLNGFKIYPVFLLLFLFGFSGLPLDSQAQPQTQTARVEKTTHAVAQQEAEALLSHILQANQLAANTVEKFELVDSEDLNAATDGKKIIFTKALWDALTRNDQRAFVLSHELAHISLNHVPKSMARRVSFLGLGHFLSKYFSKSESKKNQVLSQASQAGLVLADLKFSRRAEYGADNLGLKMMVEAGYDPNGALETLDILAKASPSQTPQFLRSHPLSKNRIRRLVEHYSQLSFK